ncbi:MFS transporter [Streptomyces prasinopilosus]|uniref:MFS transporter, DHA2 family, multidrug resistance protein n=2 Tax=Streptomyces prasinopilosus TaxID=67344 RepID=A0A1G6ZSV8_9ACTN|nr:MFS transporter, DHA2 family, multidrug resistance protein [Streptomyces prasinopilosus]
MSTVTDTPHRAGPRQWLGLAVLALPTLLLSIDVSVLHLAVPHISAGLDPSAAQMLWIIDIYGFLIAGFLVTMGTLGDRVGRRKLLLVGAAAFGVASVAAAYADSPATLIAARAALGVAGATLMPSTLALISNMFRDARQRGVAIAVWVTMFSVGIALGPVVGGAMLEYFWWGSVFLLGVPVMALLLVAGPVLLPEYRDEEAGRVDLTSVALSLAAILPVIYGLKEIADDGPSALPLLVLLAGLLMAVVFVRRQRTLESPLLDFRLFGDPAFRTSLVTLLLSMLVAGGTYLFVTQYLQLVGGLSPMKAGLYLLPAAFALIVTSVVSPIAASKVRPGYVVAVGLVVSALGHVVLALTDSTSGIAQAVTGFALVYAGGGPLIALGTDIVVGSAPPEQAGSAAALSETSTELGMALGVALLGSVGTAVYRSGVDVPDQVPDGGADTLAGALEAARDLPADVAAAFVDSGRAAFTDGMNAIGVIGALLALGSAVLVAVVIKSPPTGAAEEGAEESADRSGAPAEQPTG